MIDLVCRTAVKHMAARKKLYKTGAWPLDKIENMEASSLVSPEAATWSPSNAS
jgi:hypothetical protein